MKVCALILIFAVAACCEARGQSRGRAAKPDARREVLAVIEQLAAAGVRRDAAAVGRLYSADYFHTNADGSVMTKAEVLEGYKSPSPLTVEVNSHDEDRVQVGQGAAVVNSRVTYKGRAGAQPFSRVYRVTYVLRKVKGGWVVAASHASLITP